MSTPLRPLASLGARLFLAGALAALAGCSENRATGGENTTSSPTTVPDCARNAPGCACANEGKRIECGKVTSTDPVSGRVSCGVGGQVCTAGRWSECIVDNYAPGHDGIKTQALGTPGVCTNPCDLYCKNTHDVPDPSVNLLDGGGLSPEGGGSSGTKVLLADGGISLIQSTRLPDGGPTPEDLAVLRDSGGIPDTGPDGPALIFHELLPGETAQDPVVLIPGEVPSTDIYFLLDDTASMYDESAALTSAIQASPSMISDIRAIFNNSSEKVQFGFGRFEEYKTAKYVTDLSTNLAFQHILSIQADPGPAGVAAKWAREDSYGVAGGSVLHTGGTFPESTVTALMMLATGGNDPAAGFGAAANSSAVSAGVPNCLSTNWWVTPRSCWAGTPVPSAYFTSNSATPPAADYAVSGTVPCPAVANPPAGFNSGYPCWRPNKTPIVILMTDAPSHNGPGGQYAYHQATGYNVGFASPHPNAVAAPVVDPANAANDGSSFSKAVPLTLPAVGSGVTYVGAVPIRNTPNGISGSSAGGGVAAVETALDDTGASYVARELVATYPAAGSMVVGREYRTSLRDCGVTNVSACNVGTSTYGTTNANSSVPQTSETIGASIDLRPLATVANQAPNQLAYTAAVSGTYNHNDTCDVTSTSATQAATSYTLSASGTLQSNVALPNGGSTLNFAGTAPAINRSYMVRFILERVDAGQETIQARLRVKAGSAPTTSDTSSSSIDNATASRTIDRYNHTTSAQTWYVSVERQQGTASFPKVNVKYEIYAPPTCGGTNPITIESPDASTPRRCWNCKTGSGYAYVASCAAANPSAGFAAVPGCFKDNAPTCSGSGSSTQTAAALCGGVSAGAITPGSSTCCRKTCPSSPGGQWYYSSALDKCVRCNDAAYPNTYSSGSPSIPTACFANCSSGYTWDGTGATTNNCVQNCATVDAGNPWTPNYPNHRCVRCPAVTPPYTLNAGAATCTRVSCLPGWTGPSGGNCTRQSCEAANACGTGRTCSGSPGSAICNPTTSICGAGYSPTATTPATAPFTSVTCTNNCVSTSTLSKADGYRYGEMIYKFTVPVKDATKPNSHPANRYYYHFALLRSANGTATLGDANAFLYIKPRNAADADLATDANAHGKVLDCNRDAKKWNVIGSSADADRYKRAEVNSYLAPGDYYLVVDNLASTAAAASSTSPAYNFILQIGAFDDGAPFAAPSYKQAVAALNSIGAKVIGIDSSGTSCQQAGLASNNAAGTETREFLEAIGRDTGSLDGVTGKPFVVPIRQNAGDCSGAAGTNGLRDAVTSAVNALTQTLRQDLKLRAVFASQTVTSPVFVPPSAPSQFIQNVEALDSVDVQSNCGSGAITAIGNDPGLPYSSQKFQVCLPGTGVTFRVTFIMPDTIPRQTYDQYFRFDVIILRGVGEVARVPVVLKLPKIPEVGHFYRDYDMTDVCPSGTKIVWDRVGWDTDDPLATAVSPGPDGSKIVISAIMGTSLADLVTKTGTASEVTLATAKASPTPNTEVGSAVLTSVATARTNYLRVHFALHPSPQGAYPNNAVYVPLLKNWDLYISCPPSE